MTLILFMSLDANRRGYRHILDAFWDECATHGIELPTETPVSAPAFCLARKKISAAMLRAILHELWSRFEAAFPEESAWRGRRVFAVDGSRLNLARSPELDFAFGRPSGGFCPQATVSLLLNVMARVPVDVRIDKYGSCERRLLARHLDLLEPGDVLVLDRGYPSHEVIRQLMARGIDFLIRVPAASTFEAIEVFRESDGDDYRVVVQAPAGGPTDQEPVELRAVRLRSPDGDHSYYLTTLRRTDVSRTAIQTLYRLRWEAEEYFKLTKSLYFDQHQFHARSATGVEQEVFAQAINVTIARFLMASAAEADGSRHTDLSPKAAIIGLADYITRIMLHDPERALLWLPRFLARIARTRDKRRPGRSCPRRSFKPGPRWGPSGRRGA